MPEYTETALSKNAWACIKTAHLLNGEVKAIMTDKIYTQTMSMRIVGVQMRSVTIKDRGIDVFRATKTSTKTNLMRKDMNSTEVQTKSKNNPKRFTPGRSTSD